MAIIREANIRGKKLEEVFDIPEKHEHDKCGCGAQPQKMDDELKAEIDKYLNNIKEEVKKPQPIEPKKPRVHTLTPEGKSKMLENIQKAREVRRKNLDIKKETKAEPKDLKPMENKPISETNMNTAPAEDIKPVQIPEPSGSTKRDAFQKTAETIIPHTANIEPVQAPKYIIKSSFKKAPWVK